MNKNSGRTLLLPIALATILAAGAALVWMMAFVWAWMVVTQLLSQQEPNEQLTFTQDGLPLVQSTTYSPNNVSVYRTLDGQTVENLDEYEMQDGYWMLAGPNSRSYNFSGWSARVMGFSEPNGVPHFWYLVNDGQPNAHAYFSGFDAKTKRGIGYLSLGGFRSDPPPLDDQFEIELRLLNVGLLAGQYGSYGREPYGNSNDTPPAVFLVAGRRLFRVDLRHRLVEKVALDDEVLSVCTVEELIKVPEERRAVGKSRIAVRLPGRILLLNDKAQTLRSIKVPDAIADRDLKVLLTTGPESIVVANQDLHHDLTEIYWLDAQTDAVRHEQVRLRGGFYRPTEEPAWLIGIASPAPLLSAILFAIVRPKQGFANGLYPDFHAAVAASLAEAWPTFLVVCVLAAALALVCYQRQLDYDRRGAIPWAIFVLLGGPAALAGYWLHRHWPATERCRQCGATVPRDRDRCRVCSAEFPLPAPRGIEIFA